ncbi:MAG: hypothetical protein ABIG44_00820 [Planctomycetota bacterium]
MKVKTVGLDELMDALDGFPQMYESIVTGNLMTLGGRIAYFCRVELEDAKYTGQLERSFVSEIDPHGPSVKVYPTAAHSMFVRMGTRPHWAPIGPLKAWARWKLGDEKLAYPVQRSIAREGTSVFQQRKRGTKANPWPIRVVARGDFQTAITATSKRIGQELAAAVVE